MAKSKKISQEDITSLNEDWFESSDNGHPHDGEQIQKFVREALRNYSFFDGKTIYYFATKKDLDDFKDPNVDEVIKATLPCSSMGFDFNGVITSVKASDDPTISPTIASSGFVVRVPKYATTNESVRDGSIDIISETYTIVVESRISGGKYNRSVRREGVDFSVSNYIDINVDGIMDSGIGVYQFRVYAVGETTSKQSNYSSVLSANRVSASFSLGNYNWYTPFVQGKAYSVTGINAYGDSKKEFSYRFRKDVNADGSNAGQNWGGWQAGPVSNRTEAISFSPVAPSGGTGIYSIQIRMVIDGTLEYNYYPSWQFMFIASGQEQTASLAVYRGWNHSFTNGNTTNVGAYAIYHMGQTGNVNVAFSFANYIDENGAVSSTPTYDLRVIPTKPGTSTVVSYKPNFQSSAANWSLSMRIDIPYNGVAGDGSSVKGSYQKLLFSGSNNVSNSTKYLSYSDNSSFFLDPSMRENNDQHGNNVVVNAVRKTDKYTVSTRNLNFINGVDGYMTDGIEYPEVDIDRNSIGNITRNCLYIPAKSRMTFDNAGKSYRPLASPSSAGFTLDVTFKTSCVADYDEDVISIFENTGGNTWKGIRIKGDRIMIRPSSKQGSSKDDRDRDYTFMEDEEINVIISFYPNYANAASNVCFIYVNGAKVREFEFTGISDIVNNGYLTFGSDTADLTIYGLRIYNRAFTANMAMGNYIGSLPSYKRKYEEYDTLHAILNQSDVVDFSLTSKVKNVFVIELKEGGVLPGKANGTDNDYKTSCSLEMRYHDHVAGSPTIFLDNMDLEGQGTSAMNYWRWNVRLTSTSKTTCKYNGSPLALKSVTNVKNKAYPVFPWAGTGNTYVYRLTGKKNFASGSQSNKMGFARIYNELYDSIVTDSTATNTAVRQYPFFGFLKQGNSYTFIGLYTLGPDKGDECWFGFNGKNFLSLEGANSENWMKIAAYNYPSSAMKDTGSGFGLTEDTKLNMEYTAGGTGKTTLKDRWKAASDFVFRNAPMIYRKSNVKPTANYEGDLSGDIHNRPLEVYSLVTTEDTSYGNKAGDVYYFDVESQNYKKVEGVNAISQVAAAGFQSQWNAITSNNKKAPLIRKARIKLFKNGYRNYFNSNALFFEYMYKIIFGVSDNFMKNYYPFLLGNLVEHRQDDLDTLGPINNSGRNGKPYYCEFEDVYIVDGEATSETVFSGTQSNLAQLLSAEYTENDKSDGFDDERKAMAHSILNRMVQLGGQTTGTYLQRLMAFFDKYVYANAQKYFPASAYNADIQYCYEDAQRAHKAGLYGRDDALTQVMGPSYETSKAWFQKRMIYCMTKYQYGDYGLSSDGKFTTNDDIYYDASTDPVDITLKYALTLYPFYVTGEGTIMPTGRKQRLMAGDSIKFANINPGSSARVHLPIADYMTSLYSLNLSAFAGLSITSARLVDLQLGSETLATKTKITSISFNNCLSLENVILYGVRTLNGPLDFRSSNVGGTVNRGCPRISYVDARATGVTQALFDEGSKVSEIMLPSTVNTINFVGLRNVSNVTLEGYGSLADLVVRNCDGVPAISILKNVVNGRSGDINVTIAANNEYYGDAAESAQIAQFLNTALPAKVKLSTPVTGNITLKGVSAGSYPNIRSNYPNLTVHYV